MVLFFVSDISDGATPWIMVLFWMDAWEISWMWCNQGTRFVTTGRNFEMARDIINLCWQIQAIGWVFHKSVWLMQHKFAANSLLIRVNPFAIKKIIKIWLSWKTNVKSMNSVLKSPRQLKFRVRSSNDIEEGSYVSYCKLDGGMFSMVFLVKRNYLWIFHWLYARKSSRNLYEWKEK